MVYPKDLERFVKHPYRMKRLEGYFSQMSTPLTHHLMDPHMMQVLSAQGYSYDDNPRSVYDPEKLFDALAAYAPGKIPDLIPSQYLTAGISLAYKCFAKPKAEPYLHVLPLTPATVELVTQHPAGSAGLTNYGATKEESKTRALERGIQTLKRQKAPEPCLAGKRTQFNNKTRLIWMYPYSMTVIEGLVFYPILQQLKRCTTPMTIAKHSGVVGTGLRVSAYHKEWHYVLDASQFDAHISRSLLKIDFSIWRTWYDPNEIEPVTGVKVSEIFDLLEHYTIYTPIVMPDGYIYKGKSHGQPSGSYTTNMNDSVNTTIYIGGISLKFNMHVDKEDIAVDGDDGKFSSNRKVDLDDIARFVQKTFNIKLHGKEKSKVYHYDEVIFFEGRYWDNGLPDLDKKGIIDRMVNTEEYRRYPRDRSEIERQVRLTLLNYAATYRSAWRIASDVIDPNRGHYKNGCANIDVNVYDETTNMDVSYWTSGLMRYRQRYIFKDTGCQPNTAMLFWL